MHIPILEYVHVIAKKIIKYDVGYSFDYYLTLTEFIKTSNTEKPFLANCCIVSLSYYINTFV